MYVQEPNQNQCTASGQQILTSRGVLVCAGKLGTNSPKRAAQLRKAIEKLGPAYVKVAQAVSTRGDVLDVNYLREIERLQDRVPPFPTKAALLVMTEGQCAALLTYVSISVSMADLSFRTLGIDTSDLVWSCSCNSQHVVNAWSGQF